MHKKPSALESRLGVSFLKTVDEWRRKQKYRPSRAEAIRRLVDPVSLYEFPAHGQPRQDRCSTGGRSQLRGHSVLVHPAPAPPIPLRNASLYTVQCALKRGAEGIAP